MVWCNFCAKDQETENDDINGFTCCTGCGRVLDDNVYSSDPTFTKTADGQAQVQGNFIKDRQYGSYSRGGYGEGQYGYATDSHEKTLEKGKSEIRDIADFLALSGRDDAVEAAHRLYILAVERNFTRGRRTNQVAAACLYIICRQDGKPFLLIDFCDCLQTNVYILGGIFLQLCRLLSLQQHPIMQKPVDPSLFIHRFTDRLVGRTAGHGKKFHSIANTALRLVASMKRDWMQTGRRPSGICGAALYISAHIHGFECTKTDVISVVHICEGTLTKRLIEFEQTESGSLTAEEFDIRAREYEMLSENLDPPKAIMNCESKREVLCEHKGESHFSVGLCQSCYQEFVKCSGGMQGGAAPPAFQALEKKRLKEEEKKQQTELLCTDSNKQFVKMGGSTEGETVKRGRGRPKGKRKNADTVGRPVLSIKKKRRKRSQKGLDGQKLIKSDPHKSVQLEDKSNVLSTSVLLETNEFSVSENAGIEKLHNLSKTWTLPNDEIDMEVNAKLQSWDDAFVEIAAKDEETLSDIDDSEVDIYLHNHEEVRLKTIIWMEMNRDYIEKQEAKQEALAASQAAREAALAAGGPDTASALELAAATANAVALLKKDRRRKRDEARNKGPAESATEATLQMLESKRFSSKVNYSALEKLYEEKEASYNKNISENEMTTDSKGKHAKPTDNGKQEEVDGKEQNEETKDEMDDEDFNEDRTNMEDHQFTNYDIAYVEDYGYDEYGDY